MLLFCICNSIHLSLKSYEFKLIFPPVHSPLEMEGQVEHIALWDAEIHTFILHILANVLLNIKFPKGGFTSDGIEEPFLVPPKPFSEQFLNESFLLF